MAITIPHTLADAENIDAARLNANFDALGTSAVPASAPAFSGNPSGNIVGGTYAVTPTAGANTGSITVNDAHYIRVGAIVLVNATGLIDPVAATTTVFDISLPVASNFANTFDAVGVGVVQSAGGIMYVTASIADNRAVVTWEAGVTTEETFQLSFTYQVI